MIIETDHQAARRLEQHLTPSEVRNLRGAYKALKRVSDSNFHLTPGMALVRERARAAADQVAGFAIAASVYTEDPLADRVRA